MAKFKREVRYEVIKLDDLAALEPPERQTLWGLIRKIQDYRENAGKPRCNAYVVVNQNEPYAEQVWALIEAQEQPPCK
jgi:hypothetical protein